MTLLQPATFAPHALKLAAQGSDGSGKSLTLTMIAIGLSKQFHQNAPVAFFDTEQQSDFVEPVCTIEGVPLLAVKSKTFIDMRDSFREAEKAGCCAFLVDSYMHPHDELFDAYKKVVGKVGRRLSFHDRDQPMGVWADWVDEWKASPMHCLFASRLGFKWGQQVDEHGDIQSVKLGTKMRGDNDGGYEPNLVIELESIEDTELRHRKTRGKQGTNTHWMRVVKDRTMVLNGRNFGFKELNGYTQGDYEKVYGALAGHISKLAINVPVSSDLPRRDSQGLFSAPRGESAFAERTRRVEIAVEELQGQLSVIWPGSTNDEKKLKHIVTETLFRTLSWTAIGAMTPEAVESGLRSMKHFRDAAQDLNVKDEAAVIACIQSCKDLERERSENVSVL